MAASWFVRGGGKVYGPLDSAKLKQLVAEGKINETTEVAQNQAGPWYPAGKVRGLFETAPVTPASAPAPQTYAAPQPYIPPPAPIAESPAEDLPAAPIVNIARRTLSTYYPRSNNGTMVLVAGLCSVASLGLGYFAGFPAMATNKLKFSNVRSIKFDGRDDFFAIVKKNEEVLDARVYEMSKGKFQVDGHEPIAASAVKALVPSKPNDEGNK